MLGKPLRTRLALYLIVATIVSCNRNAAPTTTTASAAYNDGFEVVVFDPKEDGSPNSARSLRLKDAEQALAAGAQALLPTDPTPIQQLLSAPNTGDSRPLLTVQPLAPNRQQVRLAFHESSRTFVYEYIVDGQQIRPLKSEYRDLTKSKITHYTHD